MIVSQKPKSGARGRVPSALTLPLEGCGPTDLLPPSRFVVLPAGVEQAAGSVTHPLGFRAAGLHAGLKRSGRLDLGVLVSDTPCSSAVLFTTNAAAAAPVRLTRGSSSCDRLRGIVVNAGNANACTGKRGLGDAARMRRVAADALRLHPEEVAVASTGVIGVPLPIEPIVTGITAAAKALTTAGGPDFAAAIRTTDRTPKAGALTVHLGGGQAAVRIGLAAKGAGMISPRMATTLCFVTTDAVIPQPALDDLLRRVVARSFNSVTVDGQQSTNDMVLCLANGASGVAVTGPALTEFEQVLEAAMLSLAVALVGDGEGSTHTVRLTVRGAWDDAEAAPWRAPSATRRWSRRRSSGQTPTGAASCRLPGRSWARVAAHGSASRSPTARSRSCATASRSSSARPDGAASPRSWPSRRSTSGLTLHRGPGTSTIYFSDLSHEYVSVNSEGTT